MTPPADPRPVRRRGWSGWTCAALLLLPPGWAGALALSVEGEAVAVPQAGRAAAPALHYRFKVHQCESRIRSEWHSASGDLLAWDEVEFDASRWRSYRLVRPNLGQDFRQQAAPGRGGRGAAGDAPFLAGPMLIDFTTRQLPALRAGRTLEVRYLIGESGQDVKLRLRAIQSTAVATVVTVDAAQVWLRPLIPRAQLEFDAAGRFAAMHGQILPQGGTARHPEPVAAAVTVLASRPTSRCNN
jgi:hypothetical protein